MSKKLIGGLALLAVLGLSMTTFARGIGGEKTISRGYAHTLLRGAVRAKHNAYVGSARLSGVKLDTSKTKTDLYGNVYVAFEASVKYSNRQLQPHTAKSTTTDTMKLKGFLQIDAHKRSAKGKIRGRARVIDESRYPGMR